MHCVFLLPFMVGLMENVKLMECQKMLTLQIDLHMSLLVSLGTTAIGYCKCREFVELFVTLVYTYKLALVTLQNFPSSLLPLSVPCNLSMRESKVYVVQLKLRMYIVVSQIMS